MIRLHSFDDGVDDVVHLHSSVCSVTFFQEVLPQCHNYLCRSFNDRLFQHGDLRFGQVSNGQVCHRSFG